MPKRYAITVIGELDSSEGRITELAVPDYPAHAREEPGSISLSIVSQVRIRRLPDLGWFHEPAAVVLDWVEKVPGSHTSSGTLPKYYLPWDAELKLGLGKETVEPFEGAAGKVEEVIRTRTGLPFTDFDREQVRQFLNIVREDYRIAKLRAAARNMLRYATQPEIEKLLKEEVAKDVVQG